MISDLPAGPCAGVRVASTSRDASILQRACAAGLLLRIRAGAYVEVEAWQAADRRQRSLLRLWAVSASRGFRDIVSHTSAGVLLGLPLLHEPADVHFTAPGARSTRSRSGVVWHSTELCDQEVIELPPFRLTNAVRTLADIAFDESFPAGVAATDGAIRLGLVELSALSARLRESDRVVGRKKAERVVAFADGRAANPGESLSRVVIDQLGFSPPTSLQEAFVDASGLIGYSDFWWADVGAAGELDGFQKYAKPEYLKGRSPSQVVVEEKARERRIEALPRVSRVVRWVWADVVDPPRLHRILTAARVPRR